MLGSSPKYSWLAGILILVVALLAELLPIVAGTGQDARFDWSFPYVTLHFVVLPLAAALHLTWNAGALFVNRARPLPLRLRDLASASISVGYLLLLLARPVFPLWGGVL